MSLIENISSIIPQKNPFIMIDELIDCSETIATSAFQIKGNNILVEENYFSEAGLIENIAQTTAAHAGYFSIKNKEYVQLGYIGAIKNLQIFSLPKINDKLITEIKIINQVFNATILSGKVFCNDKLIAECEMKVFINNES